jgi:genome maintenance exonuclease 1
MIEEFLNNDQPDFTNPVGVDLFRSIKPELIQRINNIHAQEVPLYSKHLGLAGRVDCIAEFDGRLSVIDFKTSRRPKKKEWIKDYFLQACAYSIMWEERTQIPIDKLVIMVSVMDGDPEIYVEYRDNWDNELCSVIREYYGVNELEVPKGWGLLRK